MSRRRYRQVPAGERFLLMPEWVLVHERWRSLSVDARVVLVDVCKRWNGVGKPQLGSINNNGRIAYGCRAANKVGIGKDACARALTELIAAGFLDPDHAWKPIFRADGTRHAREFRITFLPTHARAATWRKPTQNGRRILLEHRVLNSAAYRSLPSAGKVVLIELMRREDGSNNGRIVYGGDDGAHIGMSLDITKRAIAQVKERGFAVETGRAIPRLGISRKWRLTMIKAEGKSATSDFLNWRPKNAKPVCLVHLKPADGLSGAPNGVLAGLPADCSEAHADRQNDTGIRAATAHSGAQNPVSSEGIDQVHHTDTYRKPSQRGPMASAPDGVVSPGPCVADTTPVHRNLISRTRRTIAR